MSLPRQIQEQADRAEQIEKDMQGPAPDGQPGAPPQEPLPPDQQQGAPAPAQPATPQPAPPPTPPAPAQSADPEETWEQRYRSLQGTLRTDTARFTGRIQELEGQLTQANRSLVELAKAPPPKPPAPELPAISDKDKAEFGPEIIDLISRQATAIAAQATATIKDENDALKKQLSELGVQLKGVSSGQEETRRQGYFSRLAQLTPDWEAVNADQGFMDWLAQPDPASGMPRQSYLSTAWASFDADRTAHLFNTWKGSLSPGSPAPKPNGLAAHASPATSRSSAPRVTEPDVKVWSHQEIAEFYGDVTKGKYTPAEAAKTEAEIDAAVATGRVR